MSHYLFTSESVAEGHPDKIADQISDAILDACLKTDPHAKVACETLVTTGLVVLAGEISTSHHHDFAEIARQTIKEIGYDDCALGFSYQSCGVVSTIHRQSPEISAAVADDEKHPHALGAGDQGMMFGYACNDTPELMPLPIMLSHLIVRELHTLRHKIKLPYLRPDAKSQVTVEYDHNHHPKRIHTVVLSTQHDSNVNKEVLHNDMRSLVERLAPQGMIDPDTLFYINPAGSFTIGGPQSDCGLTGRKIMVDTYGGMGRHGGGAFSGKDPTKVDRSGAYMARYVAKNIVAAKLADRCEVQISYAIGIPYPVSVRVETFGTNTVSEDLIEQCVPLIFDLTPKGMIEMLDLRRPIFRQTSFGGHFGRHEKEFSWEKTNKAEALLEAIHKRAFTINERSNDNPDSPTSP